jgi:methyl-accepting chemotaxis protein
MGYSFEEVQAIVSELVDQLPVTVEVMNKFKNTVLSQEQKVEFAKKAIETRFDKVNENQDIIKDYGLNIEDILKPTRKEDEGDDLWNVFNVLQEKVIDGDFEYISGVKLRKARRIKNFKQDLKINQELYEIASQFV